MPRSPHPKPVHEWRIEYRLDPARWVLLDVSRPALPGRYLKQGEHDGLTALLAACVAETRGSGGGRVAVVHPAVDSPLMFRFSGCGEVDGLGVEPSFGHLAPF